MKPLKSLSVIVLLVCLFLIGCDSAESPQPTAEPPENTAAAQIGVHPTLTPLAATLATAEFSLPTDNPSSDLSPTPIPLPTPTLYPDVWLSGIIWSETDGRPTFYVGNGSIDLANAQITYEPLNESVAAELAQFEFSTLVVFYGDYTPSGDHQGHLVVERVEPVHLPYSEDTPLSESYTHPNYGFSFNYPGGWTLWVLDGTSSLLLYNSPPGSEQFLGPGTYFHDPTNILTEIRTEEMPLTEIVQARLDVFKREDLPPEYASGITVTEQTISGLPVTQIDQKLFDPAGLAPNIVTFVISLNDSTSLIFHAAAKDIPFVERLIATLSLP